MFRKIGVLAFVMLLAATGCKQIKSAGGDSASAAASAAAAPCTVPSVQDETDPGQVEGKGGYLVDVAVCVPTGYELYYVVVQTPPDGDTQQVRYTKESPQPNVTTDWTGRVSTDGVQTGTILDVTFVVGDTRCVAAVKAARNAAAVTALSAVCTVAAGPSLRATF